MMINRTKFFLSLFLALTLLLVQAGGVFALPGLQNPIDISGIVQSLTLETDATTGVTTVIVDVIDSNESIQQIRVSLETAISLGLVALNGDGKPEINLFALGKPVEIDQKSMIPDQQKTQHPVGSALATFFSDIAGIDYETIMSAREQGIGFGVIAQTLWLTTKLEGDAEIFEALLNAKQTGDYSAFILEDGSSPKNWGQLRKAILNKDKKNSLGIIMSDSGDNGIGSGNDNDKEDTSSGNNVNNDKDKDKNKDNGKDKDKDKKK